MFILRVGERKKIDGRAKESLASRIEYKIKEDSLGIKSQPLGFLKFDLISGKEEVAKDAEEEVFIEGNDLEYFESEPEAEAVEKVEEKEEEKFVCEECGKEFDSAKALRMHGLSHKK